MTNHLVWPDSHTKPGISTDRFEILANYVLETKPDTIIELGDFADMASLSSYDQGKKSFEGRRYNADIEAARNARERFEAVIRNYNQSRRRARKEQYCPRKVSLLGNHEDRIRRACELAPQLEGTISAADIGTAELGWEVHPFLDVVVIDGIAYSHYFTSGVLGRSIGGEHAADTLLTKQFMSCTSGHSHLRDFSERTLANGNKIVGLFAGCFLALDQREEYAGNGNNLYWKGIVECKDVRDGFYNPNFISLEELYKKYA